MVAQDDIDWIALARDCIEAHDRRGCFVLEVPEYRPDLARQLACELSLRFCDYRAERMEAMGRDATRLSLADLDRYLQEKTRTGGVVAFNIESLLASKTELERRQWLARTLAYPWILPLVVPLCLFAHELAESQPRFLRILPEQLAGQTLVSRLLM